MARLVFGWCVVCVLAAGSSARETPVRGEVGAGRQGPAPALASVAHRLWAVTELILEHHIDPNSRQEMLLAAVKAVRSKTNASLPANLSRRVSAITTKEQFVQFLKDVWPSAAGQEKEPTVEELQTAMFAALLRSVPGEPNLLPPASIRLEEQISGNRYVGTGIQIGIFGKERRPQIVNAFRGGPARRAGSRPGDLILQVDGKDTRDVKLSKVVDWLRGEEGTKVTMTVRQPGETQSRTLNMTRGVIPFDTVFGYRRISEESWQYRVSPSEAIAYVWVEAINSSTLHQLRQAERLLRTEGARALVLDLRFSQLGGTVHQAALVADGLLDGGLMWRLQDAQGREKEFRADRECLFRGWPLGVLVNEGTSGTAPLAVAAALQDNGRAVLVGEPPIPRENPPERARVRPAGREGYVTSIVPLPDGQGGLSLRTGRLLRANPKMPEWAVSPDHRVTMNRSQRKALHQWLGQKELSELPAGAEDKPPDDPQLARAVQLLRAALQAASPPAEHQP